MDDDDHDRHQREQQQQATAPVDRPRQGADGVADRRHAVRVGARGGVARLHARTPRELAAWLGPRAA